MGDGVQGLGTGLEAGQGCCYAAGSESHERQGGVTEGEEVGFGIR